MEKINTVELIKACDVVNRRCVKIADTYHGSSWLFDKLMRYFESEPSAIAVTIPVTYAIRGHGDVTISRSGELKFTMSKAE